jgi:hypothetical protein
MTQAGLTNSAGKKRSNATTIATTTATAAAAAAVEDGNEGAVVRAGSKRKFALDADELGRIAEDDKARARRAIEDEKVQSTSIVVFISTLTNKNRPPNQHFLHSGHRHSHQTYETATSRQSQKRPKQRPHAQPLQNTIPIHYLYKNC